MPPLPLYLADGSLSSLAWDHDIESAHVANMDTLPTEPDTLCDTIEDSHGPTDDDTSNESGSQKHYCVQTEDEVPKKRRKIDPVVKLSGLVQPKSLYENFTPPLDETTEWQAISDLRSIWDACGCKDEEHVMFKLNDFCIYLRLENVRHSGEFTPLHTLMTNGGPVTLLFDGILSIGKHKRYVQRVPFQQVTVEGYGDEELVSLERKICLQSLRGSRSSPPIWYELGRPDIHYSRYHKAYLWIALLGKFFVDFLIDTEHVTLDHLRSRFGRFLTRRYKHDRHLTRWLKDYKSDDFRQAVVANIEYLWKECWDLGGLLDHPIWGEARRLDVIPEESSEFDKTVVTPFVYECFKTMPFQPQMRALDSTDESIQDARKSRRDAMKLTPIESVQISMPRQPFQRVKHIYKGDVVCLEADKNTYHSNKWRKSDALFWFAYVQAIRVGKSGSDRLDVIWLYQSRDTTLGHGYYPFQNELFMSDHCDCGKDAIDAELVVGVANVRWFATNPADDPESFFVRQKYRTVHELGAYDFVTLQQSDFECHCHNGRSDLDELEAQHAIGDTVLVRQLLPGRKAESLEPAQIVNFWLTSAKPNQISLTDVTYDASAWQIIRRCYIRMFPNAASVSAPFDKDGAGDFFFIIASHDPFPVAFRPAQILTGTIPQSSKLKGLGIFCGGGNFDRGLEEGGAVKFRYAVDWNSSAMHTYRANLLEEEKDEVQLFLGSVNDYLTKAIEGSRDKRIAKVGDVEFLAAGSPCPGFSNLQPDKQSLQSLQNYSLVAAVVAQVDFYMPSVMVLENVKGMANHPKGRPDLNVFSQVLCGLVAIGYQVQQFLMDPTSYGSCQSRARIFVIASAPGCPTLPAPPQTHSSACGTTVFHKQIGRASNGIGFGEHRYEISPFNSISIREAMGDLPDISESHVQTCIEYPDHRTTRFEDSLKRNLISAIPRWPYGMSFVQTVNMQNDADQGRTPMGRRQIETYPWKNKHRAAPESRSWSRLHPDRAIGCLTTRITPHDAFLGRQVHWDQPRILTVMEARRTQGFLDDEIIIGAPYTQWRIIGNSVDRKVAFALGLSLGRAWQQTLETRSKSLTLVNVTTASPSSVIIDLTQNSDGEHAYRIPVKRLKNHRIRPTSRRQTVLPTPPESANDTSTEEVADGDPYPTSSHRTKFTLPPQQADSIDLPREGITGAPRARTGLETNLRALKSFKSSSPAAMSRFTNANATAMWRSGLPTSLSESTVSVQNIASTRPAISLPRRESRPQAIVDEDFAHVQSSSTNSYEAAEPKHESTFSIAQADDTRDET